MTGFAIVYLATALIIGVALNMMIGQEEDTWDIVIFNVLFCLLLGIMWPLTALALVVAWVITRGRE